MNLSEKPPTRTQVADRRRRLTRKGARRCGPRESRVRAEPQTRDAAGRLRSPGLVASWCNRGLLFRPNRRELAQSRPALSWRLCRPGRRRNVRPVRSRMPEREMVRRVKKPERPNRANRRQGQHPRGVKEPQRVKQANRWQRQHPRGVKAPQRAKQAIRR